MAPGIGLVLVAQADAPVFAVDQPVVAERDAVAVAGQVFDHLLAVAETGLGVDLSFLKIDLR